mgnify:CR=1 FL=1
MSVIIFIIILVVLILAHEFGHFIVAKWAGMRVDEFGIGFPPKLWSKKPKHSETTYSVNAIPFGGFVKIFGEDRMEDAEPEPRSFSARPRHLQAAVIVAGVVANFIFAWLLLSVGFLSGFPTPAQVENGIVPENANLLITAVSDGSPAEKAGILPGDHVLSLSSGADVLSKNIVTPEAMSSFIATHGEKEITITYTRDGKKGAASVTPVSGILTDRAAIGITMDLVEIKRLPIHQALFEGGKTTIAVTKATVRGFWTLISESIRGNGAGLSAITGPVGIVGLVGDTASFGFAYLIAFTAFISINLAVINIIPFPALDGGRLFFLAIETAKGSHIKPAVTAWANGIGFVLLILLMVIVTFRDIMHLIG